MAFAVGDTVGPYRITGQIGQGGMATVYQAYHANLDRYVALKVLHPAFKEDPTFLERFKREARIVARLEHPHIVPVYDFADFEGQPYLIMKFIEGETLKARLKRQPLALDETLHILATVASALTYAHDQGILHRDIKPSNIMLDQHGTPYIADFGLARIAQAGESTMSQDMMLGTPQYISPEQAKGVHDLGPGTDIYSLGVVIYELTVGRVPFNADTPYAIVHDHIYKPLPLPSKVNPAVPLSVERVLLRALAKEPEARYQSAVEMVDDFQQAVQSEALTELSAARYQPPAVSSTAETLPETPSSPPPYGGVPSPVPPTGGTTSQRVGRRRANLWIVGGVGALLLVCLVGLFIAASAVSDHDLLPWNADDKAAAETDQQQPTPESAADQPGEPDAAGVPDMTPGEDPAAYLYLVLSRLQAESPEQALTTLSHAIDQSGVTSGQIATAARRSDGAGHADIASWLYLEALTRDGVTPDVRSESGEYLYNRIQDAPAEMRVLFEHFMAERPDKAVVYTLDALALLANDRVLTRRQALSHLNTALDINDKLAETYLVRGLYYQDAGLPNLARADWQRALSFDDAPDWVTREAERLLQAAG
jgi:serine/threonine protein kinase/Tfp pilus assembly protein PilF